MRALLTDALRTLAPPRADRHGPLPPLLLLLTVATGVIDAVSYLGLGHVFVANMTGNVVFLGFALAGAPGLSATASLVSLGAFLTGALAGGRLGSRTPAHRGRLLALATGIQTVLTAAAAVTDAVTDGSARYALIVLLGVGMGLQNAVARRLGVPDLTTTVLTLTLTGLAADSTAAGGTAPRPGRRILSALAMLLGGLAGAALILHGQSVTALALAAVLLLATALAAHRVSAPDAHWAPPVA
ncbi:YoaK family protein [Streptomyces sp. NRRL S-350]|uniref:YoaK family protein n=1 Tax=Streptomyces sp. NRRL S-350 TaxID=1463902 RepID=UPI0004BE7F38|nr:YoaK family protein [Streptomyces sp. NRRL S-350]